MIGLLWEQYKAALRTRPLTDSRCHEDVRAARVTYAECLRAQGREVEAAAAARQALDELSEDRDAAALERVRVLLGEA